jgi:hypothetical protein
MAQAEVLTETQIRRKKKKTLFRYAFFSVLLVSITPPAPQQVGWCSCRKATHVGSERAYRSRATSIAIDYRFDVGPRTKTVQCSR